MLYTTLTKQDMSQGNGQVVLLFFSDNGHNPGGQKSILGSEVLQNGVVKGCAVADIPLDTGCS